MNKSNLHPKAVTGKALASSGITLISLVVTIIVLLILTGVVLNLITGSDGILGRATNAADRNKIAGIQEDVELAVAQMQSEYYEAKYIDRTTSGTFPEYATNQMSGTGYTTSKGATLTISGTTVTYTDKNGDTVTGTFDTTTGEITITDPDGNGTKSGGSSNAETFEISYDVISEDDAHKYIGLMFERSSGILLSLIAKADGKTVEEEKSQLEIYSHLSDMDKGLKYILEEEEGKSFDELNAEELLVELADQWGESVSDLESYLESYGADLSDERILLKSLASNRGVRTWVDYEESTIDVSIDGATVEPLDDERYDGYYLRRNGTYQVTAKAKDGSTGSGTIKVSGIDEEKFDTAKTQTEYYTDANGKKAIIPKGFSVGKSSNINTIENGLVITDQVDSNGYSIGNEYVWIPVDDPSEMYETITETSLSGSTGVKTTIQSKGDIISEISRGNVGSLGYREPDILTDSRYGDTDSRAQEAGFNNLTSMAQGLVTDISDMKTSIETYKGFWIGRFELTGSTDNPTEKPGYAQNNKNWYELYKACKNLTKTGIVEARMISGNQWDEMCKFINAHGDKVNLLDSTTYGNYNGSSYYWQEYGVGGLEITGFSKYWKANNIYDIAGNENEWTQEAYGSTSSGIRRQLARLSWWRFYK